MGHHFDTTKLMRNERRRVILPDGIGTVEIMPITRADGTPGYRVVVQSDTDRFGPAIDGRNYNVSNGDPGPGVVFLLADVSRETEDDS
jgi:hypothetical protein